MQVNSNSWHARLYKNWYKRKYNKEHNGYYSNLCPYMRAVMFWSWMRPLFLTKWYSLVTYLFFAIEIPIWIGIFSYDIKFSFYVVYGAATATAVLFGIIHGLTLLCRKYDIGDKLGTKLEPIEDKAVSFFDLIKEYSRD